MDKNLVLQMVKTNGKKQNERKVWAIPLESVVVPFLTMTNAMGVTSIDRDALGCPLRLARNEDRTPKISKAGRLIVQVAKPIASQVRDMRDNYIATLKTAVSEFYAENKEQYESERKAAIAAGQHILASDNAQVRRYNEAVVKAIADAEVKAKAEADSAKAEAEAIINAQLVTA